MSAAREQAVIDAPARTVWGLVGDPNTYPEWLPNVLEITEVGPVEKGGTWHQVTKTPLGRAKTTFRIEDLDDVHEIHWRCQTSGSYGHWTLTDAQGSTFVDVEMGMDPTNVGFRMFDAVVGRRMYRRETAEALDALRQAVTKAAAASGS